MLDDMFPSAARMSLFSPQDGFLLICFPFDFCDFFGLDISVKQLQGHYIAVKDKD